MTLPSDRRYAVGEHFALPLSVAAVVLGLAQVALILVLVLVVVLAVLRAMLFPGDR
ncbi:hypothetical protein [Sphingomonas sp. NPDC079357]|uniref:hypothetical protein n=1 Tax=Sphingomonas sp. NPDC079357 TaxID=3364518 RepID=UPI00385114B9